MKVAHVLTDYRLHEVVDKRGTCPFRLHTGYTMSLINVVHVRTDYRLHEVVDKGGTCPYRLEATRGR